jgi:outer membrane protein OmpA-like peptidoglycan-associated protein
VHAFYALELINQCILLDQRGRLYMQLQWRWFASILLFVGVVQAQEIRIQVELMNTIGSGTSKKGDLVSARVLSPAALQGDIIEGTVTNSDSGSGLRGKSVLRFSFETLRHSGQVVPISSQVQSVANSKGQADVDEEGYVIRKSNNLAKVAGATGAGALVGGLIGGGKGAAIGAVSGAAISIVWIDVASDGPSIRLAPGSKVTLLAKSRSGPALTSLSANPASARTAAVSTAAVSTAAPATASVAAAPAQTTQPAASSSQQPQFTTLKSTFVPGEKTISYDDFTDMGPDDAPPHFKVRGASLELRASGNVRQLMAVQRGSIFPNLTALPKNFTFETEMVAEAPNRAISTMMLQSGNKQILHVSVTAQANLTDLVVSLRSPYSELGRKRFPTNWTEPVKLAVWVQDGRLRVFVNGEKQLDFNQVEMPAIDKVEFAHDFYGGKSIGYRMMRFAESTPDFSQVINSSGRYVTHGILFDTDSDSLKPESAPVIQQIAKGLELNPSLKLLIEGHTDSVGNAAHNIDLSKRRADAVKSVLVSQFSVDASRLMTNGLGATKPIDSNDTPQGRAQNRRVEFVKQ